MPSNARGAAKVHGLCRVNQACLIGLFCMHELGEILDEWRKIFVDCKKSND